MGGLYDFDIESKVFDDVSLNWDDADFLLEIGTPPPIDNPGTIASNWGTVVLTANGTVIASIAGTIATNWSGAAPVSSPITDFGKFKSGNGFSGTMSLACTGISPTAGQTLTVFVGQQCRNDSGSTGDFIAALTDDIGDTDPGPWVRAPGHCTRGPLAGGSGFYTASNEIWMRRIGTAPGSAKTVTIAGTIGGSTTTGNGQIWANVIQVAGSPVAWAGNHPAETGISAGGLTTHTMTLLGAPRADSLVLSFVQDYVSNTGPMTPPTGFTLLQQDYGTGIQEAYATAYDWQSATSSHAWTGLVSGDQYVGTCVEMQLTGVAADNFNRANTTAVAGALGAAWDNNSQFYISSNVATAPTGNSWVRYQTALGPDQYVEADLNPTGGNFLVLNVRAAQHDALNVYQAYLDPNGANAEIGKNSGGSYSTLSRISYTHGGACRVRFEVQGSTLRLFRNGVQVMSFTDTSIATGDYAGFNSFMPSTASGSFDNFTCGALTGPLPARHWGSATDEIKLAAGALATMDMGPSSHFALIRIAHDTNAVSAGSVKVIGSFRNSADSSSAGTAMYWYVIDSTAGGGFANVLELDVGTGGSTTTGVTLTAAEGWVVVGWTKPTGSSVVRWHKCVLSTGTWAHFDGTGSAPDITPIGTGGFFRIGRDPGGEVMDGDIAAYAVWDRVLTDAEINTLDDNYTNWLSLFPVAFPVLDQTSTATAVTDRVGTSNQISVTGTSVTAAPSPLAFASTAIGGASFDGSTSQVKISATVDAGKAAFAGDTVLALVKTADSSLNHAYLSAETNSNSELAEHLTEGTTAGSGADSIFNPAGGTSHAGVQVLAANGWHLIGHDKVTGNNTPRHHTVRTAIGTWTHAAGSAALGDTGNLDAGAEWYIGSEVGSGEFWSGEIALVAWWSGRRLTDAEYVGVLASGVVSLSAILALSPTKIWYYLTNPQTSEVTRTAITAGTASPLTDDRFLLSSGGGGTTGWTATATGTVTTGGGGPTTVNGTIADNWGTVTATATGVVTRPATIATNWSGGGSTLPLALVNDPCENFTAAPWTVGGTVTVVAGGYTGNAFQFATGSSSKITYAVASGNQRDTMTVGLRYKPTGWPPGVPQDLVLFYGDAGVTNHVHLKVDATGKLTGNRGSTPLTSQVQLTLNVWNNIEISTRLHDTLGFIIIRLDGVVVASATNVDTYGSGTLPNCDTVVFFSAGSGFLPWMADDIYIRNDANWNITGWTAIANGTVTTGAVNATATPAAMVVATTMPSVQAQAGQTISPAVTTVLVTMPFASTVAGTSATATPAVLNAIVTMPAVTTGAGQTTSPSFINILVAMPAVQPRASSTLSPAVLNAVVTMPGVTAGAGVVTSPGVVNVLVTMPAVAVSGGGSASPAVLTAIITMPFATTAGGTSATASPAVLNAVVTMPLVQIQFGRTISPAVLPVLVTMPLSTQQAGWRVSPAVLNALVTMPGVATGGGAIGVPAVLPAVVSMPAAIAQSGSTVSPAILTALVTLPAVTAGVSKTISPAPMAAVVTMPLVQARAGQTATVAVLVAPITMPPTASAGASNATASPAVIQTVVTMPAASPRSGSSVAIATCLATITMPAPSIIAQSSRTVSPAPVNVVISMPSPSIVAGGSSTVNLGVLLVQAIMQAVTVQRGATVFPAPIAVKVNILAVDLKHLSRLKRWNGSAWVKVTPKAYDPDFAQWVIDGRIKGYDPLAHRWVSVLREV